VFGLPGIGTILFAAIKGVDFPTIQGIIIVIILALTFSTLILDLILPVLDPRIQYGRA
jgi:ABC-type dipeptide/oligopeptide/nickel transport system permease component